MTKPPSLKSGWDDFNREVAPFCPDSSRHELRAAFYMGAYFTTHAMEMGASWNTLRSEVDAFHAAARKRARRKNKARAASNVVPFKP